MTIWLLALVLLASVAALGYRQGAIRVAFSFFGILVGALLAVLLGRYVGKIMIPLGVRDPLAIWLVGPLIVFVIVSGIFKVFAAAAHRKADVYYKYRAGDLRLALWERLNLRLGACLGLLNGAAYLILLSFVIYLASYCTYQFATSEDDPRWMRIANRLGVDLHGTGFAKVGRSLDHVDPVKYEMVDLAGMLYRNPLAQARLSRYPAFLPLAEKQEFQELGGDQEFAQSWMRVDPVTKLAENSRLLAIRGNPELLATIWNTTVPVLGDLTNYLTTGMSSKFDSEKILGRWNFDPNATMNALRRAKPNMVSTEMQKIKRRISGDYAKTSMVAMPDAQVILKNMPSGPAATPQNIQGQWKKVDGKYELSLGGKDQLVTIEGDRFVLKGEGMDLAFSREL